jgi:glutamate synthase domain-containing protein 3
MTGGHAYLLDPVLDRLNADSVVTRGLDPEAERRLRELVAAHSAEGSSRASALLADWEVARGRFVMVEPVDGAAVTPIRATEPLAAAR